MISTQHLIIRGLFLALAMAGVVPISVAQSVSPTPTDATKPVILARGANGNVVVTTFDVLSELQRAPVASRPALFEKPEAVQQYINNLLMRRALAQEAERDGLAKDPLTAVALQIGRDRVLSDARLAKLDLQNEPTVAAVDAQARRLYQANLAKLEVPAQTRARHILLANTGPESLAKAKELITQLRAGASFEEMAKQHSTDSGSAVRGGDLGFFSDGQMVRPFEEAVSQLKAPGDLSGPVESQFGYHIIKLEERKPKGVKSFEDVKAQLMAEARTSLLNEARVQKAESLNKGFAFEKAAFDAFVKAQAAK
jgi:peptidyl-prolyl cis-trans isomerase C